MIVIQKSSAAVVLQRIFVSYELAVGFGALSEPTIARRPAASTETSSCCCLPLTLVAVRFVVITPRHRRCVDAREVEVDPVQRVAGRRDEVRERLVEHERRVDRAVGADRAGARRRTGSAGVTPSSLTTFCTDEVISADLIIAGVQFGCAALTSAETPAACGLDIEVPAIAWYRLPGGPLTRRRSAAASCRRAPGRPER